MRKVWILIISIFLFIGVLVIVGVSIYNKVNRELEGLKTIVIDEIDLSTTMDGTYIGSYETTVVKVKVAVTVVNHTITEIEILKHDNGQGKEAEEILNDVIESQSVLVDSIAGATYSSKVILLAIIDALD